MWRIKIFPYKRRLLSPLYLRFSRLIERDDRFYGKLSKNP